MIRARIAFLLAAAALSLPVGAPALANPAGSSVQAGSAAVSGEGSASVTVNQTTDKAIINWRSFDIGNGEVTTFVQPGADSVTLNRVTGGLGTSKIDGTLKANGRVFLVNPDGILFGPQSIVDVGGLVATTHDIADDDFMAGRHVFGQPGRADASVVNAGTITAATGGFAALVAPGVRNSGTISARLGTVGLAAASRFTLDFYGDDLIKLSVDDAIAAGVNDAATGQPLDALVKNEGLLKAAGGVVQLSAAAARQVVDSVINNTGIVEANSVGLKNGRIVLSAATASTKPTGTPVQKVKVAGKLSAAGKNAGEAGGKVQITGEDIAVTAAGIDASGAAGGGTVLIGGDVGGGKPSPLVPAPRLRPPGIAVPNSTVVDVDSSTSIDVSATEVGDGGETVLWADGVTSFTGWIGARGGPHGGNGGFVETSGKKLLDFRGIVDRLAPFGLVGSLLLDPENLTIQAAGISSATPSSWIDYGPPGFPGAPFVTPTYGFASNQDNSILTVSSLEAALALGDVYVATGLAGSEGVTLNGRRLEVSGPGGAQAGDIIVASDITLPGGTGLRLHAYHDIIIKDGVSISLGAGAGFGYFLGLIAGGGNSGSGAVRFEGANSKIYGGTIVYNPVGPNKYQHPTDYSSHVLGPYAGLMLVNNVDDLQHVGDNLAGTYALVADIDASGTSFVPIGDASNPFTGGFNGFGGHIIDHLTINSSAQDVGLFGYNTGTLADFILSNLSVTGTTVGSNVGGVAGYNAGIIVATASGSVQGSPSSNVGLLVGQNAGWALFASDLPYPVSVNFKLPNAPTLPTGFSLYPTAQLIGLVSSPPLNPQSVVPATPDWSQPTSSTKSSSPSKSSSSSTNKSPSSSSAPKTVTYTFKPKGAHGEKVQVYKNDVFVRTMTPAEAAQRYGYVFYVASTGDGEFLTLDQIKSRKFPPGTFFVESTTLSIFTEQQLESGSAPSAQTASTLPATSTATTSSTQPGASKSDVDSHSVETTPTAQTSGDSDLSLAANSSTGQSFTATVLSSIGVDYLTMPALGDAIDVMLVNVASKFVATSDMNWMQNAVLAFLKDEFRNEGFNFLPDGRLTQASVSRLNSLGASFVAGLVLSAVEDAVIDQIDDTWPSIAVEEARLLLSVAGNSALVSATLVANRVPASIAIRVGLAAGIVQASTSQVLSAVRSWWQWRADVKETNLKLAELQKAIDANQAAILEAKKLADETGDRTSFIGLLRVADSLSHMRTVLAQSKSPLSTEGSFWSAVWDKLTSP